MSMSQFNFQSCSILEFSKEDDPRVFFEDDRLMITAERNNERILISAPLPSGKAPVVLAKVKAPKRKPLLSTPKLPTTDSRVGENSKMSKLTVAEVTEIKQILADPKSLKDFKNHTNAYIELGKMYNVHFTTIANIAKHRTWKHVNIAG